MTPTRIADLLTELRIEGTRDSLIEEIVEIANQFGIVTPYTAYLAEEPDMDFFADDAIAAGAVAEGAEALAAAPASGEKAVRRATELNDLREGKADLGTASSQALGSHTFYLVDGAWTRDDFEEGTDAPEVEVGSAEFLALIAQDPGLADAAALGERVVTEGPDGWITITWPNIGG